LTAEQKELKVASGNALGLFDYGMHADEAQWFWILFCDAGRGGSDRNRF
jgi:hypothetical protein